MDLITINVRGTVFMTDASNIRNILLTSPLLNLNEQSKYYNAERQEYFFDRNASVFESVLDYFVTNKLHVPTTVCAGRVRDELAFWGIPGKHIEKCCWKTFFQSTEDMNTIQQLLKYIPCVQRRDRCCSWTSIPKLTQASSLRSRMWKFLHDFNSSTSAKVFHALVCLTIILSTVLLLLQTVSAVRFDNPEPATFENHTSKALRMYWNTTPHLSIICLEAITNAFLTIDWILRFITCPNRMFFMKHFLNVTDLVAWVGTWMSFSVITEPNAFFSHDHTMAIVMPVCLLTAIRGFRVFRLISNNCGVKILMLAVVTSTRELCILLMTFSCAAIVFAVLLYSAQLPCDSPTSPPNALFAIWWAVITMTTVGYGDYYPTEPLGHVIGVVCAITGIVLIALPVAVTSSTFNDFYSFSKYRACYQELLDQDDKCGNEQKTRISTELVPPR
ncbi:potassium voltage-gated channel protein Shaw-like [Mizuhopecten yessoensis]|uniref:Potassium voltage-gated channel protein Shaw n=1 Tax=Mizuhopecten yessoensis TaxID=6573 RepID=A0A210Q1T9_MIZYE|nr:potassium voltage-gated channel protein Shaw-like [Mizuhopecten yessoensis]OWF42692.1 Potassium voltage-gated channel protein Shaw [Mizuhopecten yessoensis]